MPYPEQLDAEQEETESPEPQKSTKPQAEKNRYIDFMGNPIGLDGKAFSAITNTDIHSVGFSGILYGVLVGISRNSFLTSAVEFGVGQFIGNKIMIQPAYLHKLRSIFGDVADKKCIDMFPDERTVPTLGRYGLQAEEAKRSATKLAVEYGLVGTSLSVLSASLAQPSLAVSFIGVTGSCVIHGLNVHKIFKKVATGEWVIVDWPEPKKAEEPKKTGGIILPVFTDPGMR